MERAQGKRPVGRHMSRRKDNIEMIVTEKDLETVYSINLSQNMEK